MGKFIILAFILIIGAITYFKDFNIQKVNPDYRPSQKEIEVVKAKALLDENGNKLPIFKVGECIIWGKDKWNHIKIRKIEDENYYVSKCRLYSKCEQEIIKYTVNEVEELYSRDKLSECQPD